MRISLAMFKQEYSTVQDVLAVLEVTADHLVVTPLDGFVAKQPLRETVRKNTVNFLPLSLSVCEREREFRVDGCRADEDLDVEILLVHSALEDTYDIVRRFKGCDTVLNDGALTLGHSCGVLAACEAIDWQCLFSNTGDIETVCISNATAIVEGLEAA